jgi:hypothetical protein
MSSTRVNSQSKSRFKTQCKATASPLVGKIVDSAGEPLLASHTTKPGKPAYRYYVSKALHRASAESGLRLPAREVEQVAAQALAALFADPLRLIELAELEMEPAALEGQWRALLN